MTQPIHPTTISRSIPGIIRDLGQIDYLKAWDMQKDTVLKVINGESGTIFLCEHPSVLTLGRLAKMDYILAAQDELDRQGVTVVRIDRGGEVTLHAPGQLIVYLILNLATYGKDLLQFLRKLEQVSIDLLQDFGILAKAKEGLRGVWVDQKKIVSIGVGVRKWVSYHGLALNVNTDLKLFRLIKPCGLDVDMISMQVLLKKPVEMNEVKRRMVIELSRHFELALAEK